jgi:hypothetical protein
MPGIEGEDAHGLVDGGLIASQPIRLGPREKLRATKLVLFRHSPSDEFASCVTDPFTAGWPDRFQLELRIGAGAALCLRNDKTSTPLP